MIYKKVILFFPLLVSSNIKSQLEDEESLNGFEGTIFKGVVR